MASSGSDLSRPAASQRERNLIRLLPDHREQIRRLLLLQAHHESLARQQAAQVEQLLTLAYCVDLAHENWSLDTEHGVLNRVNPSNVPAEDPQE